MITSAYNKPHSQGEMQSASSKLGGGWIMVQGCFSGTLLFTSTDKYC